MGRWGAHPDARPYFASTMSGPQHTCKVEASRDYICEVIPVGQRRDFALRALR